MFPALARASLPPAASGAPAPATVSLTFNLPAGSPPPQGPLTVLAATPAGELTLQTPAGRTLTALTTLLPPPAPGTRLSFPPLPSPGPAATSATPPTTVIATLLPPLPPPAPPNPALPPQFPQTQQFSPKFPAIHSLSAINAIFTTNPSSSTQYIIPEGPISNLSTQISPSLPNQSATLTLSTPTAAILTLAGESAKIPLQLATPTQLPTRQPLSVALVPGATAASPPVLLLTQPVATSSPQPVPAPTPFTPPLLSALKVLITPGQNPAPVPLNTPLTARVLTSPLENNQQSLLLATGHRAVLQSPQAFPAESILVVEFPTLTGPANVLQAQASGQQSAQPQPNLAQPGSPHANPPPPGTVVQGTLTLPGAANATILTISQPAAYAGQTLAVNLPPTLQGQLPEGTALTARVETTGAPATLITLTLPAAAQRALTLTHLAQQWPALTQALNLLGLQAPALAQAVKTQLPQLANLLPGLLTFADALRKQSPETALGKEAVTLLRSLGPTLGADFQHLAQLQAPQPDTAWRGLIFPYMENPQADPRQGGFFWRREKRDDPRAATATRFIVQMDLTRMGAVQLDGLVTYPEVWLKLRRATPAEEGFVAGLQTLVNGLLEQHGLSGGIAVEVTSAFPVDPIGQMLAAGPAPLPTSV